MQKIICIPDKDAFGKKTGCFKASFGKFETLGKTKQEATENMNSALDWFFSNSQSGVIRVRQTIKRIYILTSSFYGFEVQIINKINVDNYCYGVVTVGRCSLDKAIKLFYDQLTSYVESTPGEKILNGVD